MQVPITEDNNGYGGGYNPYCIRLQSLWLRTPMVAMGIITILMVTAIILMVTDMATDIIPMVMAEVMHTLIRLMVGAIITVYDNNSGYTYGPRCIAYRC